MGGSGNHRRWLAEAFLAGVIGRNPVTKRFFWFNVTSVLLVHDWKGLTTQEMSQKVECFVIPTDSPVRHGAPGA